MPLISCTLTTLRRPSSMRSTWITMSIAEEICERSAFTGKLMPVMDTMFSMRPSASRGVLA